MNSIVDEKIHSLHLIDPTAKMEHAADKLSILDLRATTENGNQINIELQLQRHTAFNERILYYWAKTYTSQIKTGDPYTLLQKVIQIIIVDFDLLPSCGVHSTFLLTEPSTSTIFSNHLEIHALQLGRVGNKPLQDMSNLEKWLLFFKGNQKEKEEVAMESSAFKEAFEEIERLSRDPETVQLAISREMALRDHIQRMEDAENRGLAIGIEKGIEKGIEQGIEQGIEKGKRAKQVELIVKLHEKSSPLSFIAEVADLSIDEVQEIIQKHANQL